ncbi:helix-turn-helix transcriptional regulator [Actinoallomurus vinaceus]|uniref:Helix-turn-helix transcriptional regulator n=1 Tax=Actinoallomurus vinaceus TaxID=1080074 RepID=A0ABP8UBV3_9ACTN
MEGDAYGATIAKRRLSRILTDLRLQTGHPANHICDTLTWGRGKVGRFEANAWKRPEMSDIRDLLRVYEADEATRREVEDLAIRAKPRAWWRDSYYQDVFEDGEFPGFEADASEIRTCMPLILPGLLQTEAYIRAQMEVGTRNAEWCERALRGRLRRQAILDRDENAPRLIALITEASLRYRWGSAEERRDQIQHLIKAGQRTNVEIRILRFQDGFHPGMNSLINAFTFPYPDEPPMVYLETDTSAKEVDVNEARSYLDLFERIRSAAVSEAEGSAFLSSLVETME